MTTVELAQGTKILIDGVETTVEAFAGEGGDITYEWIANPDANMVVDQSEAETKDGQLVVGVDQNVDQDADRLTDSNSSDKMSPPHDEECVYSSESGVPINFPIKGRILARLQGRGFEYFMTKSKIVIGRDSSKGSVDINMGQSSFISRNHLTIVHEENEFYLSCGGKNGVFVDDFLQKIGAPRMKIPKSCVLRFPSTQIVIAFDAAECFIEKYSTANPKTLNKLGAYVSPPTDKQLTALRVQIPPNRKPDIVKKPQFFSPCPSPAGTISAVNSCPTSPNGAGNVPVFARKALSPHKYVTTPEAVNSKDSRIPITEDDTKPPYSYAQLIVQAISSTPQKQMTLSGIYAYISRNYSYYRANDKGWQNSIRHNLSLNRYFIKVARSQEEPGKGCFWAIDSVSEPKLVAQAFRRRNKRGVPYFRGTPSNAATGLTTKSCPSSPTRTPINITIVAPDVLNNVTTVGTAANSQSNAGAIITTATIDQAAIYSAASAAASNNNNNIVTVATSSSLAEAMTMQQSRVSHVIDMNSVRAIQSAPGSPLTSYKVLSPVGSQHASLLTAKMLPKGATQAAVIGGGPKSSGITLLQPITSLTTLAGKTRGSIVTLALPQSHLLRAGSLLTPVQTIPVTSTMAPLTATPLVANTITSSAEGSFDEIDAVPPASQPRVEAVPVNQQPIRLIQLKRPADGSENSSAAKIPRTSS